MWCYGAVRYFSKYNHPVNSETSSDQISQFCYFRNRRKVTISSSWHQIRSATLASFANRTVPAVLTTKTDPAVLIGYHSAVSDGSSDAFWSLPTVLLLVPDGSSTPGLGRRFCCLWSLPAVLLVSDSSSAACLSLQFYCCLSCSFAVGLCQKFCRWSLPAASLLVSKNQFFCWHLPAVLLLVSTGSSVACLYR